MHPEIGQLVRRLVSERFFVYLCTNGLLMEKVMEGIPPSSHFSWVVHLDGTEKRHDEAVDRPGVFKIAMRGIDAALRRGHRVCTNTTIFRESNVEDLHLLFGRLTAMGVEGLMVSPAFEFKSVPDHEMFLEKQESIAVFREILDRSMGFRFYNNPLYLDFLRGERVYRCNAWANPTFTVRGWRKPCYLIADEHVSRLADVFDDEVWKRYGSGNDPRCANCMMHCGFEPSSIFEALKRPADWLTLLTGGTGGKPTPVEVG
jgi:hopanoid biosynthesis associated radical SAM protein HpnH